MKKYLMSTLALLVFSVFMVSTAHLNANADEAASTCGTDQKMLVFHYYNYSDNYDTSYLYVWNTGSSGSTDFILKSGTDNFGAYYDVCIDVSEGHGPTKDADADTYTMGAIPVYGESADWDHVSKDSYTGMNINVDITNLITTDQTQEDVYFLSGADGVIYGEPGYGTAIVAYFDAAGNYDNVVGYWWGNDQETEPTWGDDLPFAVNDYYQGVEANHMVVIGVPIGPDADDAPGFIVNDTQGDQSSDLALDATNIKGSGANLSFYAFGADSLTTDATTFAADAFRFHFVPMRLSKTGNGYTNTYAPNPGLIEITFNQAVTLTTTDDDGNVTNVFEPSFFTLTENDGDNSTVVDPSNYQVNYLTSSATTTSFAIQFLDDYQLDNTKTYTLSFDNDDSQQDSIDVNMDTEAPEIAFMSQDDSNVEITQGSQFTSDMFPAFVATDDRDGTITNRVYVPTGEGNLNTGVLGAQPITLQVEDNWGNVTTQTFTITVVAGNQNTTTTNDNGGTTDKSDGGSNTGLIIGIAIAGVAVVAVAGVVISKKFSK